MGVWGNVFFGGWALFWLRPGEGELPYDPPPALKTGDTGGGVDFGVSWRNRRTENEIPPLEACPQKSTRVRSWKNNAGIVVGKRRQLAGEPMFKVLAALQYLGFLYLVKNFFRHLRQEILTKNNLHLALC